jgi:hypothetical protein
MRGSLDNGWRWRTGLRAVALVFCILGLPAYVVGQAAPPPPKPGAPDKSKGFTPHLQATDAVVYAYLTGLAALKYCKFGSEENVAAFGQGFNLTPKSVDPDLAKRILSDIDAQVGKGREAFCRRAWERYGAHGSDVDGLLTMAGTADVAGWIIEPIPTGVPSKCEAYRKREGVEEYLDRFIGSAEKPATSDVDYAVITPRLSFELFETPTAVIEVGSARQQPPAMASEEHEVSVTLNKELQGLLAQSPSFTLHIKDTSIAVPFERGADVLAKLQACVEAYDPSLARWNKWFGGAPKQ